MAKRKKISRKKLLKEPDEFITISGKMIQFAVAYKTQLTYAISIVAVLIVLIAGYRFFSIRSENEAMELWDRAITKYETAIQTQDAIAAYRTVSEDFNLILERYGNSAAGKLARVTFANICFNGGEFNQAIELYEASLKNFEQQALIYNLILSGLGYANEELNQNQRAVTYFEKIAAKGGQVLRDEALFNLGVLYDKLGEKEKSQNAFNQITSDFPDSMYIDIVKERPSG